MLSLLALVVGCDEHDSIKVADAGLIDAKATNFDAQTVFSDGALLSPDLPPVVSDAAPLFLDGFPQAIDSIGNLDSIPVDSVSAEFGADAGYGLQDADHLADIRPSQPPVTVIVMPDTQYYAGAYPAVFTNQTRWIADQKSVLNIAALLHVGDIVDTDNSSQWAVASSAMRVLDGLVPYVLATGNHDYSDSNRKTTINSYFGPASMPWISGTMTTGLIENSYSLIDIGPKQWLILSLEFSPRNAVMDWADAILKAFPDRPAMIVTHAYLYHDGTRYDIAVSGLDDTKPNYQYWIPQFYNITPNEGINDGQAIWQKLVLPNANVRLVFSGHDTGSARLASTRPDGSLVHQMLTDFQWYRTEEPDYFGGGGYLRILEFDYNTRQIRARTYSPYLNQYLTDDAYQFVIGLDP
jgi:hypothetical protein